MNQRAELGEREPSPANVVDAVNRVLAAAADTLAREEIAEILLEEACALTGSGFGFVGELNDAGRLDTLALGDPGWAACREDGSAALTKIRNMEVRGLWGRVVLSNRPLRTDRPARHPDSVGVPEGHPPLESFLGVPLRRGSEAIGVLGLANRPGGYRSADERTVMALAETGSVALRAAQADSDLPRAAGEFLSARSADLVERAKEMDCMLQVSELCVQASDPELLCRAIVERLPEGWSHPERTSARLVLASREYRSQGFQESDRRLVASVRDSQSVLGRVEVHLAPDHEGRGRTTFLAEERALLDGVAGIVGSTLERLRATRNILEDMENETVRCADIVQGILSLARQDSERRVHLRPRSLAPVIRRATRLLKSQFRDRGAEFSLDLPQELPQVLLDAPRLQQVLLNLLDNALDAVEGREFRGIHLVVRRQDDRVELRIMDSGSGIPAHIVDKVFDPFFTTKEPGRGTGLGLATARAILREHGTDLSLTRRPEGGTEARFALKCVADG